ncbi:MAG: FdtA/QdtA family cupin domain-containing protein, partial [Duncaniella sp.]|nr:FdtA/QdtA family cupin domain-containing protein [Duncaniella sp.]
LVIATGGSFNVNLYDGDTWNTYTLNRPYEGLYIPPGYWRTLDNFASGSVCMVLTSIPYSEDDYVRDYEEFKRLAAEKK